MEEPLFDVIVHSSWSENVVDEMEIPCIRFKNKLKVVKMNIRKLWNEEKQKKLAHKTERINWLIVVDKMVDDGISDPSLMEERSEIKTKFCLMEKKRFK